MTESCPTCQTDILVSGAQGPYYRWQCHGCGKQFGAIDTEPIAYDAVDEWYVSSSPDGVRLHADRSCLATSVDAEIRPLAPAVAREHRHSRCLTCGHEVVEG
ncbi:hypothetical protein [Halorubrum halodurans]|uniref:Uncharacterized protein n=1 Tax=Halorubrum halodurans TaxID=1383851 RepID=A0A256IN62_9EURY|nr:hypothetical protein [Halorubrum halodurans]OYR57726.1 hypothetical protein DJ70_05035 [Halorubrum halodurans]